MSQPTREEIIDAHRALTSLSVLASDKSTASAMFNEKIVRAFLPPFPELTMAEIAWDDEKHYLAEAETEKGLKVIMLGKCAYECIEVLVKGKPRNRYSVFTSNSLAPTGKRYTLTEVQE